ncbi:hypothetical protein ACQY0O_003909 [Thecaphora frezii]
MSRPIRRLVASTLRGLPRSSATALAASPRFPASSSSSSSSTSSSTRQLSLFDTHTHLRRLEQRGYATSTTAASSSTDPAEEEAQRFLEQGTSYLEAGDLEEAKKAYRRSLEVKPSSSAWFNLGVCFYHDHELDSAISAWTDSLRLAPDSADAHTNLASAYVLSKPSRPDLAVSHLKTAATITPDDPEIQYNLAAVLEACEQLEDALIAYKRALKGGIQRAEQNIRNCSAKILGARVAIQQQEEEQRKLQQGEGKGKGKEREEGNQQKAQGGVHGDKV